MARTTRARPRERQNASLQFSRINWVLLAAGLVSIAAGYLLVTKASTVAAPLLLVLGYVVLIPLSIIL
jgi:uncharacterized membrane protein HdeD (DUF308 family)